MMNLTPRKYQTIPIYANPWRRWSWRWLKEWLDPREHWACWKTFWQRGRRGWADRDCWSLDSYVSDWMGDAIHHLYTHSITCDHNSKKGRRAAQVMIEGFDACVHVRWWCECFVNKSVTPEEYLAHDAHYRRRWEIGMALFVKHFYRLWW